VKTKEGAKNWVSSTEKSLGVREAICSESNDEKLVRP